MLPESLVLWPAISELLVDAEEESATEDIVCSVTEILLVGTSLAVESPTLVLGTAVSVPTKVALAVSVSLVVKLLVSLESLVVGSSVVVSSVAPLGPVSNPPMETEDDAVVVAETETCVDSMGLAKLDVAEVSIPVATSVPVVDLEVWEVSMKADQSCSCQWRRNSYLSNQERLTMKRSMSL